MAPLHVFSGMSLRDALRDAERLRCIVYHLRRTGEILVRAPLQRESVKINARRKDAPRALTVLLRRLTRPTRSLVPDEPGGDGVVNRRGPS